MEPSSLRYCYSKQLKPKSPEHYSHSQNANARTKLKSVNSNLQLPGSWLNSILQCNGLGQPAGELSCSAHRCQCGRSGVRFPGRSIRTQCHQRLATAAMFLRRCIAQAPSRGEESRHSLQARCAAANIMKIYLFF